MRLTCPKIILLPFGFVILLSICIIFIVTIKLENSGPDKTDVEKQMEHFEKKSKIRQSLIKSETFLGALEMYIVPQISCPTVIRIGTVSDGGKWICNPWRIPNPCIIYSLGINFDASFEQEMFTISNGNCRIYSFDIYNQDEKLFSSFNGIFKKWNITAVTNENQSEYAILDIVRYFSHTKIDVLKMDIESSEFTALPPLLESKFVSEGNICQILLELHDHVEPWKQLQRRMEKVGYLMFYKEANTFGQCCHEYSYIHKTCLKQYGLRNNAFQTNYE